jgi:hypothetical protein
VAVYGFAGGLKLVGYVFQKPWRIDHIAFSTSTSSLRLSRLSVSSQSLKALGSCAMRMLGTRARPISAVSSQLSHHTNALPGKPGRARADPGMLRWTCHCVEW